MCFYHTPMVRLTVEKVESMAVLNVDYRAWIVTVLEVISNFSFILDLNYFLWKLKTLKRQGVSFLLETNSLNAGSRG